MRTKMFVDHLNLRRVHTSYGVKSAQVLDEFVKKLKNFILRWANPTASR